MNDAGVTDPSLVYFVDDSGLNIDAAQVSPSCYKSQNFDLILTYFV